jgi:hypothetical protein
MARAYREPRPFVAGATYAGAPNPQKTGHPVTDLPLQRRGLLGLIAALPIFGRCADAGPPSFALVPALQPGQEWRFAFERKVVRGAAVVQWYRAPLQVRVLGTDADGALLEWREGEQTIVDADPQRRPLMEIALAALRDVPLQLRVDASGRVQSLVNVAAVRAQCLELMDIAAARLAVDPAKAPMIAAVFPAIKAAFGTDAMVTAASLREPAILLGAMGRRYGAREPVEFRTDLPNPMGGAPVPAIARLSIRSVSPRSKRAELGWLMVSDPVATQAMARAGVEQATRAIAAATFVKPNISVPEMSIEERGDFVVDTATAWPVRVTHQRTVRAGTLAEVDQASFSLA